MALVNQFDLLMHDSNLYGLTKHLVDTNRVYHTLTVWILTFPKFVLSGLAPYGNILMEVNQVELYYLVRVEIFGGVGN